jgi:hypothetical protein
MERVSCDFYAVSPPGEWNRGIADSVYNKMREAPRSR